MSYLVLARKWRPLKFADLVGQPHVARTLLNGLKQKRLAHAYIFSGPRGVGKTTTARLLARAVNCLNPNEGEPCGDCPPCLSISAGNFIDVVEIDAASNTGVDDVRKLRDSIRYAPLEGRAKVYIIDEVHMLSVAAFNALLKTLEEPPEHAYFCLATTEVQKIPATIVSRCQRFDFRRVSIAELRAHLAAICRAESVPFEETALDVIARRAEGSVRDSLSILDQVLAYTGGTVMRDETVEIVGEVRHDLFHRALWLTQSRSESDALALDAELAQIGADVQDFVSGLESYMVQVMQIKAGGDHADLPPDALHSLTEAAGAFSGSDLIRLLQMCSAAENDIRRNFNPRLRLQLLLLKFAHFDRSVEISQLLSKLETIPSVNPSQPSQPVRPYTKPAAAPAPSIPAVKTLAKTADAKLDTATVGEPQPPVENPLSKAQNSWNEICDRVAEEHNSRGRMLKFSAYPVEYSNGRLKINCTSENMLLNAKSCIAALTQAIVAVVGGVRIDLGVGPLPEESPGNAANRSEDDDAAVKLLMERFGAKPVK